MSPPLFGVCTQLTLTALHSYGSMVMAAINLSITLNFNCGVLNEPTPQGVRRSSFVAADMMHDGRLTGAVHRRNDRNHPAGSGDVIRPEVRREAGMDGRLYTACAIGNLPQLQQLAAVDPDILNQLVPSYGKTLLHVAVESRRLEIIRYLLANRPQLVGETYGPP
ncbi:hypothetical protein EJ110_NYTH14500 [Nymphaea thermarum]|nr:hypothetical protein EJ110_NYTH14500 [Nymphaea thermarum]